MDRYDVVVVGSGAAGSFAALELGEQGLSVLVLEAGRNVDAADMRDLAASKSSGVNLLGRVRATLTGQPVQARVAFFNRVMARFLVKDSVHGYRTPRDAPFLWFRGRQVGGRLHIYGRVLLRWSNAEFAPHPGSGGTDWPIRYADLAPYYSKAEQILSVQGNRDGVATMPDGFTAGPGLLTRLERRFKAAVEARWPDRRVTSWRFAPPDDTPVPKALHQALETGNVTLQADAIVTHVLTDQETGRATGVRYVDRISGGIREVESTAVVLGASPIETVRVLLHSRSERHPDGIGNSNGLLGRFFMDQPSSIIFANFDDDVRSTGGTPGTAASDAPAGGVYLARSSDNAQPGYTCQGTIGRQPHAGGQPTGDGTFMCFSEMAPRSENRIMLDQQRHDRWGMPIPIIACRLSDVERSAIPRQINEVVAAIEEAGGSVKGWVSPLGLEERGDGLYRELNPISRWIVRKMLPRSLAMGAAIHESGGARMGNDPRTSVLNSYNQCWDAPNVVVVDASAFASSGVMGTTLTVMALAMRSCDRLAGELRKEVTSDNADDLVGSGQDRGC